MNYGFSSRAFHLSTSQLLGMSEAQLLNTVVGGFGSAGAAGSAQVLDFAASFSVSRISTATQSLVSQKLAYAATVAPLPFPQPSYAGPPAGRGLTTDPEGWPKGSVRTAGGYTIVPEGGSSWKIYNPGAKPGDKADTHIHGDPHVSEKDGGRWDFTKNSDFVLPDGTRINAKTSSEKGKSVTTGLEITNGADHVSVTGVNGKPTTSAVKHDGYEWRAQHMANNPYRDTFKLGGDGDDWFLVRDGQNRGEITGAYYDNKTQTYQQKVDGRDYRVDPRLRPPIGTQAWGNQLRSEALDFIGGRLGLDPLTARDIGRVFHLDHLRASLRHYLPIATPLAHFGAQLAQATGPAGPFGGTGALGFGLRGGLGAVSGMSQVFNQLRDLGAMASVGHAIAQSGFVPGRSCYPSPLPYPTPRCPDYFPHPTLPFPFPLYWDESAAKAIAELAKKPGPIDGDDIFKLVVTGTADLDGQAAGAEYAMLKRFVQANWHRMTPDAKAKWAAYEKAVMTAKAQGQSGIPVADWARMVQEMGAAGYRDSSSGAAVEDLKRQPVPISGQALEDAIIKGTGDLDNQAAGAEYEDLAKYVHANWDKLSPEAKAKWRVYQRHVWRNRAQGRTGIPQAEWQQMVREMKAAGYQDASSGAAVEQLYRSPRPISGEAMEQAIISGTADLDGHAASAEYQDLARFVRENWSSLSWQAKAKWSIYERYVIRARLRGQSGISQADYARMLVELRGVYAK